MTELENLEQLKADIEADKETQFDVKAIADAKIVAFDAAILDVNAAIARIGQP